MQGSIAQAAALTMFGNAVQKEDPGPPFWPSSTVFEFCRTVTFVDRDGSRADERRIADDPVQWRSTLESGRLVGLRLHHAPSIDPPLNDRLSTGFVGGGGRWLIEAVGPATSDLWEADWQVGDPDAPDRRIWNVTYIRVATGIGRRELHERGLNVIRADLAEVLPRIEAFALRHGLDGFAPSFRTAIDLLDAEARMSRVYHSDLAAGAGLPAPAEQLLAAAQAAWVFGAMGSWNDVWFDGQVQAEYEAVSDGLFDLLIQAICEATNSSFSERGQDGRSA